MSTSIVDPTVKDNCRGFSVTGKISKDEFIKRIEELMEGTNGEIDVLIGDVITFYKGDDDTVTAIPDKIVGMDHIDKSDKWFYRIPFTDYVKKDDTNGHGVPAGENYAMLYTDDHQLTVWTPDEFSAFKDHNAYYEIYRVGSEMLDSDDDVYLLLEIKSEVDADSKISIAGCITGSDEDASCINPYAQTLIRRNTLVLVAYDCIRAMGIKPIYQGTNEAEAVYAMYAYLYACETMDPKNDLLMCNLSDPTVEYTDASIEVLYDKDGRTIIGVLGWVYNGGDVKAVYGKNLMNLDVVGKVLGVISPDTCPVDDIKDGWLNRVIGRNLSMSPEMWSSSNISFVGMYAWTFTDFYAGNSYVSNIRRLIDAVNAIYDAGARNAESIAIMKRCGIMMHDEPPIDDEYDHACVCPGKNCADYDSIGSES